MKIKIITSLLLLSSSLFAESAMYVGLLGGMSSEKFTQPYNQSTSSPMGKLQIGYGDIKSYSVQLGLIYNPNDQNVFSDSGYKDKTRYSLDVELIKAFDFHVGFYPFMKAGVGAGVFETHKTYTDPNTSASTTQSQINFSSFNLGGGVYYPVSTHIVLELGATYKFMSYQKFDGDTSALTTDAIYSYGGINYRF